MKEEYLLGRRRVERCVLLVGSWTLDVPGPWAETSARPLARLLPPESGGSRRRTGGVQPSCKTWPFAWQRDGNLLWPADVRQAFGPDTHAQSPTRMDDLGHHRC
nr:hypothetical protein CFP56_52532 [Quercus suber]